MFIQSKKGLTDTSGCHIRIRHIPAHQDPFTNIDISENNRLEIEDFRTGDSFTIATFKDKKKTDFVYQSIVNAIRQGESYHDITEYEDADQAQT